MMWDVKPGDLVVHIGPCPGMIEGHPGPDPTVGSIYTVRRIVAKWRQPFLGLEEIRGFLWNIKSFRPIAKPSIENLRSHLTPIPEFHSDG